jgi:hypothetical protein
MQGNKYDLQRVRKMQGLGAGDQGLEISEALIKHGFERDRLQAVRKVGKMIRLQPLRASAST